MLQRIKVERSKLNEEEKKGIFFPCGRTGGKDLHLGGEVDNVSSHKDTDASLCGKVINTLTDCESALSM